MIEAVNIDQENCTIGDHPYTFVADEALFLEHKYWSTETAARNSTIGKKIHRGQLVTYRECLEAVKDHLENFASVPFQFVGGEMLAMIARVHGPRFPATIIPLLKTPCISYCYLKEILDQAISLALEEGEDVKRIIENIPKDHHNFALVNCIFRGTNFFNRNLMSGAYELLNMVNPHTIPDELWLDMFYDVYKYLPKIHKRRPTYTYEYFGKSICTSKNCVCSSLWFCKLVIYLGRTPNTQHLFQTAKYLDLAFKVAGSVLMFTGRYPLTRQRIRWAMALDPTIVSHPLVKDSKLLTDTMRLEAFFRGASFTCLSHQVQSGKKRIHGLGPDTIKKIITDAAKKVIKSDSKTLHVSNISDIELSLRTTEILAAVVVQNMEVFEEMTERAQKPSLCRLIFDHKVVHYNKFAVKENAKKFLPFLMSIKSLQTRTHVALYGARKWGVLIDKRLELNMSVENAVQYMIHVDTLIRDTALAIAPAQFSTDLQGRPYLPVFYLECWKSGYSTTAVFEDLHKHHQEYLRLRAVAAREPWVMQENSKIWNFDNVMLSLDNLLNIWFWEQLIVHGLFNIYGLMLLRLDNELVCGAFRDRVVVQFLCANKDSRYPGDVYEIFKHLPQNFKTPEVCREAVALNYRCMKHVPQPAPNLVPPRGLVVASTSHESDVCPICLSNYRYEERLWLTDCNHLFHERCLAQWSCRVKVCALCRSELE